jgi:hypothetical protein
VVSEVWDTLPGVRGLCGESYTVKFNMLSFSKCYDIPVYKLALKLIDRNINYSDFKNKRLKNPPVKLGLFQILQVFHTPNSFGDQ